MLEIMKARVGIGDTRALEDVHAAGLNSFIIATKRDASQQLIGYRIDRNLFVEAIFQSEGSSWLR